MREIDHPVLIKEWNFNLDTSSHLKNIDKKERLTSNEKEIDRHNSQEFWLKSIIGDMNWFPFQGIMLHAADNIECPSDHLKYLLKVLSMFKIKIIYDETIDNEDVP